MEMEVKPFKDLGVIVKLGDTEYMINKKDAGKLASLIEFALIDIAKENPDEK